MLVRELNHLTSNKRDALRIGAHFPGDAVRNQNTPLLKKDLELVLEWAEKGIVMAGDRELLDKNSDTPQELADYIATWTSGERRPAADEPSGKQSTCSREYCYNLAHDENGLIVPGKEPTIQSKRRRRGVPSLCRKRPPQRRGNAGRSSGSASSSSDELFVGVGQPSHSVPESGAAVEIDTVGASAEAPSAEAQGRGHLSERTSTNALDDQTAGPS